MGINKKMEIVQALIKKIVILIPLLLIAGFLFWLAGKFFPNISFRNLITNRDILPPPNIIKTFNSDVYVAEEGSIPVSEDLSTNYNDVSYYDPLVSYHSSRNPNPLYIRNLSIQKYDPVYSGVIITGEAKRSFFDLGSFPIFVEDMQKNQTSGQVRALDPWVSGDWIKFEVTFKEILQKNQCNLVFKNANPTKDPTFDIYTSMPVLCL